MCTIAKHLGFVVASAAQQRPLAMPVPPRPYVRWSGSTTDASSSTSAAPAESRCLREVGEGLKVASYNIGATVGFDGPAKPAFACRLQKDMVNLAYSVDVICMQEVNTTWAKEVVSYLPPDWSWHHYGTLGIFHSKKVVSPFESAACNVFPDGSGVARDTRVYQEVARRRALSPVQRLSSCVRHVVVPVLLLAVGHDVFAMCAKHCKTHGERIATCMATTWRTHGTGMATTWQTHGKYMANLPCVCRVFAMYSACHLNNLLYKTVGR